MADLYLDVGLFAISAFDGSEEEVERYVNTLTDLQDVALKSDLLQMRISAFAAELLMQSDCYPFVEQLPAPAWPQRRDILQVVNQLLARLGHIEDDDGVDTILLGQFSCVPEDIFVDAPAAIAVQRNEILCRCVIHKQVTKCGSSPIVFSRTLVSGPQTVAIECVIADVECAGDRDVPVQSLITGTVAVVGSMTELVESVDPLAWWRSGRYPQAIHLAAHKSKSGNSFPIMDTEWMFGAQFFESMNACGCDSDVTKGKNLLKACVDSISGQRLPAVHPIRVNSGANSEQRVRASDKALAWRRDIDHEYHLHYWSSAAGIQFAEVVPHNRKIAIPEN